MVFLEESTAAKASSFFWISRDSSIAEAQLRNVDAAQVDRYEAGFGKMDPLHATRIKSPKCIRAIPSATETHKQSVAMTSSSSDQTAR